MSRKNVPHSPTKQEVYQLWPSTSAFVLRNTINQVIKDLNPNNPKAIYKKQLTNREFKQIILRIGLPEGFCKSDFAFLENVVLD